MNAKNNVGHFRHYLVESRAPLSCVIRATRPLLLKFSCPKHKEIINHHNTIHVSVSWKITKTTKTKTLIIIIFLIKIYWLTNQVS